MSEMGEGIGRRALLRRGLALGVSGTFLSSALAACGDGGGTATSAGGAATVAGTGDGQSVELWSWVPSETSKLPDVYDAAGKRWVAAGEDRSYKYVMVNYENYATKLKTSMVAGKAPALANVNMDQVGEFVTSGQVLDLTEIATRLPALNARMVKRYLVDGKQYVYWPDVNAQAVLYNKTVFERLGLSAPRTFDEFVALAEPLRAGGYEPLSVGLKETWIGGDLWFQGMAYTDPSDELIPKAEQGEVKWNGPEFLAAAEYLPKLRDSDLFAKGFTSLDGLGGYQLFGTQKAAMMYPGAVWSYDAVERINNGEFEFGLFEIPSLEAGVAPRAIGGPASAFIVPSSAKAKEGAVELLGLLADPEGQEDFGSNGFVPGVVDTRLPDPTPYPLYPEFVRIQQNAATRSILVPEVTVAMQETITKLWSDRATPQDVVDAMQKAYESAR